MERARQHKLFGPVGVGMALGFSLGQTQVFSLFYSGSPVCPWDKLGVEGQQKMFMWQKLMSLFRSLKGVSRREVLAIVDCPQTRRRNSKRSGLVRTLLQSDFRAKNTQLVNYCENTPY